MHIGAKPAALAAFAVMISRSEDMMEWKVAAERTTCFPLVSATRELSLLRPPFSGSMEIAPFQR